MTMYHIPPDCAGDSSSEPLPISLVQPDADMREDEIVSKPPPALGGEEVVCWAWSGSKPFGMFPSASGLLDDARYIFGLAVCRTADPGVFYLFSCDSQWKTVGDTIYESVENAVDDVPDQFKEVEAHWQMYT